MDFLKDWSSVLEWLKRPFFAFVATAVLATLLLWSKALDWLGLAEHRWIVAIIALLSICVLLTQLLSLTWQRFQKWNARRAFNSKRIDRLHQLTGEEKAVLGRYILRQTRTDYFDLNDGVIAGLQAAGILQRATTISRSYTTFAYNITDFAWEYLNENPDLLT